MDLPLNFPWLSIACAVLLALVVLASVLAGVFVGAWITHRNYHHASPAPLGGAAAMLKHAIAVALPKPAAKKDGVKLPRMRS